jgi:3-phenylpropionate/cinnamic acid dioxygenase small subunit
VSDQRISQLEDSQAAVDILYRYATGIDRRDWSLLRSCFTDMCELDYGDIGKWSTGDEVTKAMSDFQHNYMRSLHQISNPVVKISGDRASASSYVHVISVPVKEPDRLEEGFGYFDDKLVRSGDVWRIAERTFTMVHFSQRTMLEA